MHFAINNFMISYYAWHYVFNSNSVSNYINNAVYMYNIIFMDCDYAFAVGKNV